MEVDVKASARLPDDRAQPTQPNNQPRRTHPSQSKSLPKHKRRKLGQQQTNTASNSALNVAEAPPVTSTTRESQESGSSGSASKWFNQQNENGPRKQGKGADIDDEPPFFMSNQTKYQPKIPVSSGSDDLFGGDNRDDSENDDLRGVIDDLTVENKRLKTILKSQRPRTSPSVESQDKLFEVRMHGLPPDKKRELEQLLKNFASSVNTSAVSVSSSSATIGSGVPNSDPSSNIPRTLLKPMNTDSGYGSNSGMTSIAQSRGGDAYPTVSKSSKDKTIKNYLHDIPDTLLPHKSPLLSERAKMTLVVQRLEQLFIGRKAAPGEHSHPLQQQEVSHSAARAESYEDSKHTRMRNAEGSREAHMLPPDSKVNLDAIDRQERSPPENTLPPKPKYEGSDLSNSEGIVSASRPGSPDQRPTRPLDLDIHRAQIAAENIEYLRHLGLSSPHFDRSFESIEESWIYLNLLISMAQLHTLNVTPGLIRKAIRKFSTKFELSKDGHKVRWKGGIDGTIFANDIEGLLENTNESPLESTEDSGRSSSKRSKTNSTSNLVSSSTPSDEKTSGAQTSNASKQQVSTSATSHMPSSHPSAQAKSLSAFDYKPIVFKGQKRSHREESYLDSSPSYDSGSGDSNSLVQALSRSNLNQRQHSDDGTITFFNNPYFCSDCSGDKTPANWKPGRMAFPEETLGIEYEVDPSESPLRHHDACYFTPQFANPPYRPKSDERLSFTPTQITSSGEDETQPIELPVSGLGGVFPEENFALDVKIIRTSVQQSRIIKRVPVSGKSIKARYEYRIQKCQKLELQSSRLPPPTYIVFTSSSSSGAPDMQGSSDQSDSESSAEDIYGQPGLEGMWSTGSSVDQNLGAGEESSIDMLEAARATDPIGVAKQERDYVINQPGGNVPMSGSLAATVGDSRSASVDERELSPESEENDSDMDLDE